jgi:hypothetical protein
VTFGKESMSIHVIFNGTIIVGSILVGFFPMGKRSNYAPWGKATCALVAVVGVAVGVLQLAWDLVWLVFSEESIPRVDGFLSFGRGLVIGLLLALIISGQMRRKSREITATTEPNQLPQPTPGSVTDPAGAGSAPPPVVADR